MNSDTLGKIDMSMTDHDLIILFNMIEDEMESNIVNLLAMVPDKEVSEMLKLITDKDDSSSSSIEDFSFPMHFLMEKFFYLGQVERELKKRDLLDKLRKTKVHIDYKEKEFCIYPSYIFRFVELLRMRTEGYLNRDYVDSVSDELYKELGKELKEEARMRKSSHSKLLN